MSYRILPSPIIACCTNSYDANRLTPTLDRRHKFGPPEQHLLDRTRPYHAPWLPSCSGRVRIRGRSFLIHHEAAPGRTDPVYEVCTHTAKQRRFSRTPQPPVTEVAVVSRGRQKWPLPRGGTRCRRAMPVVGGASSRCGLPADDASPISAAAQSERPPQRKHAGRSCGARGQPPQLGHTGRATLRWSILGWSVRPRPGA